MLAISFLGYVVEWHFGDYSIVALGFAVGMVLFAVGYSITAGALSGGIKANNSIEKDDEDQVVDIQK